MSDDLLERLGRGCNCGRCKLDLCCCAAMEEAKAEIEKLRYELRCIFSDYRGCMDQEWVAAVLAALGETE